MTQPDSQTSTQPTAEPQAQPLGSTRSTEPTDRRTLFRRAGLVALIGGGAAAVAACSADETSQPGGQSGGESGGGQSSGGQSSGGQSSGGQSSGGQSGSAGASIATSDVPEGGGTISGDYVITQPTSGDYKAFSKICTHQGCAVTRIENKQIVCPCHGSMFSISDGSPQTGPAKKPLPAAKVTVSGDKLTVSG